MNIATEIIYELEVEGCCEVEYVESAAGAAEGDAAAQASDKVSPCVLGHIASYYYLSYRSVGLFDRMYVQYVGRSCVAHPPTHSR